MEEGKIKVTIKLTSNQFDVYVDPKATVRNLKEECSIPSSIAADEQRLIFKGILDIVINDFE